jgi:hypothetical protein
VGADVEIESGSVLEMRDETAASLLTELNEKRSRLRFGPLVLGLGVVVFAMASMRMAPSMTVLVAVVAALLTAAAFVVDALRKTTVIMYDLDDDAAASFEGLMAAVATLGSGQRLWHIESRAMVLDRKYHAGAQSEIRRSPTDAKVGPMPLVKCNIDVPNLNVGRQTLFFTPDRLLVFDSRSIGAIAYPELDVHQDVIRSIESDGVPADSRVVDRTWKYVNKNGGPDRRFKDNREIPICEYEAVHLRSASGLNELLHASKLGVANALIRYLSIENSRLAQVSRNSL